MKKGLLIGILLGLVIGLMVGVSLTAYADSPDPWDDLQTRINNASSGATIKLSDGVKAGTNDSALTVPVGKTIILDLAGHTIDRGLTGPMQDGNVITVEGGLWKTLIC